MHGRSVVGEGEHHCGLSSGLSPSHRTLQTMNNGDKARLNTSPHQCFWSEIITGGGDLLAAGAHHSGRRVVGLHEGKDACRRALAVRCSFGYYCAGLGLVAALPCAGRRGVEQQSRRPWRRACRPGPSRARRPRLDPWRLLGRHPQSRHAHY